MTRSLRVGLYVMGALFAGVMLAQSAQAQKYPERTISIVVPYPPGGLTDVPARLLATMMQEKIGQGVIIENKSGGNGTIGVAYVSRAQPDGYTLLANSLSDAQNLHFAPLSYSPVDDFTQIGWIADGPPVVLIVNAKLPYKALGDLIADAKVPSATMSFGTAGPATTAAMALSQFNKIAGINIVAVPYRGSGDAAQAVAAGTVQGVFTYYSQAKPLVESGNVRALAVAAPTRIAAWSEIPTFQELGYNIDFRAFVGLAAPVKTPKSIVEYLNKQLNAVVQSDAYKSRLATLGMSIPTAAENTPEKYDAYIRDQIVKQGEIARLTGAALPAPVVKR